MRVLLLHPEDSPRRGPWTRQRWDLVVDLGKSSHFSEEDWAQLYGCPVWRADLFRQGIADVRRVRQIFSSGRGRLVDGEGIDWWEFVSLLLVPEVLTALAVERIAAEISPVADLWATRNGFPASLFGIALERPVRSFGESVLARVVASSGRYAGLVSRFSSAQIKEIILDKYDASYRWRARFAARPERCRSSVVVLPSAYANVSRTAAAYARLLPAQSFLLVATRQSAKQVIAPANVQLRDLAAYAKRTAAGEMVCLTDRWNKVASDLCSIPELRTLFRAGVLDRIPVWLRDGLCARDAWRGVIEGEPVSGVLCGDDSNLYTRLPVVLAARRGIPTADFHHGALDGRYLLKDLPCDVYLAKNEMERDYLLRVCNIPGERVVIGAPPHSQLGLRAEHSEPLRKSAIFFSEPYESAGMRGEEVYREILPALCRLVRQNGCELILKLHPFEIASHRNKILHDVLTPDDRKQITVIAGPLTNDLISHAWFGMTVESSTVLDCVQNGVLCFLCAWMKVSPYEYVEQYDRFGIGQVLANVEQIGEIPARLAEFHSRMLPSPMLSTPADPAMLRAWLSGELRDRARPAS